MDAISGFMEMTESMPFIAREVSEVICTGVLVHLTRCLLSKVLMIISLSGKICMFPNRFNISFLKYYNNIRSADRRKHGWLLMRTSRYRLLSRRGTDVSMGWGGGGGRKQKKKK